MYGLLLFLAKFDTKSKGACKTNDEVNQILLLF